MLTDAQWAALEPLVEACRPRAKGPPSNLRRTISAIVWRHDMVAKWRSVPEDLGPWWMAAQTFIRWSRLGVWEHMLAEAQGRGVELGMTVSEATAPFSGLLDAQSDFAGAQCQGISSSIRLCGQPLTRRVSKSVR